MPTVMPPGMRVNAWYIHSVKVKFLLVVRLKRIVRETNTSSLTLTGNVASCVVYAIAGNTEPEFPLCSIGGVDTNAELMIFKSSKVISFVVYRALGKYTVHPSTQHNCGMELKKTNQGYY